MKKVVEIMGIFLFVFISACATMNKNSCTQGWDEEIKKIKEYQENYNKIIGDWNSRKLYGINEKWTFGVEHQAHQKKAKENLQALKSLKSLVDYSCSNWDYYSSSCMRQDDWDNYSKALKIYSQLAIFSVQIGKLIEKHNDYIKYLEGTIVLDPFEEMFD